MLKRSLAIPSALPPVLKTLLEGALNPDPLQRPSFSSIVQQLSRFVQESRAVDWEQWQAAADAAHAAEVAAIKAAEDAAAAADGGDASGGDGDGGEQAGKEATGAAEGAAQGGGDSQGAACSGCPLVCGAGGLKSHGIPA